VHMYTSGCLVGVEITLFSICYHCRYVMTFISGIISCLATRMHPGRLLSREGNEQELAIHLIL